MSRTSVDLYNGEDATLLTLDIQRGREGRRPPALRLGLGLATTTASATAWTTPGPAS